MEALRKSKKLSQYELDRIENMKENKELLTRLMKDIDLCKFSPTMSKKKPRVAAKRTMANNNCIQRRNPSRSSRTLSLIDRSPPRTRSRALDSFTESSNQDKKTENRMVIKFGFGSSSKRKWRDDEDSVSRDSWDSESPMKKIRVTIDRDIRPADEITKDDLSAVCDIVSYKQYDAIYGTTCHQCRQKTQDMKTICRNENCFGVRGQFCGVCLRNRYGEDAKEALKDPMWHCPPCRGICNCSICRRRKGIRCTGILIHMARERGYEDVNTYLQRDKKFQYLRQSRIC